MVQGTDMHRTALGVLDSRLAQRPCLGCKGLIINNLETAVTATSGIPFGAMNAHYAKQKRGRTTHLDSYPNSSIDPRCFACLS